jgi:hypothetical protein
MKEERSNHLTSSNEVYLTILNLFSSGKNTSNISKELNISKQKLYKYTRVLKQLGFIKKIGYGVWEVQTSKPADLEHALNWKDKQIRGHAFIWKVKLSKEFDWKKILDSKKINYNLVRGYTPRIFINKKKVWLGKETIVIYETKSFYGKNAIQSRKYAVFELLSTLERLSKELGIHIGKPYFKPTREHYGMIKNELARQCNKKGEKIIVRDDLDGEWLWIDDSEGMLGELETGGKGFTKDRAGLNLGVQKWYNDHKKHNFEVTPTFILESINKLVENQVYADKNIVKHYEVLNKIGKAIEELREEIKKK